MALDEKIKYYKKTQAERDLYISRFARAIEFLPDKTAQTMCTGSLRMIEAQTTIIDDLIREIDRLKEELRDATY